MDERPPFQGGDYRVRVPARLLAGGAIDEVRDVMVVQAARADTTMIRALMKAWRKHVADYLPPHCLRIYDRRNAP